MKSKSKLPILCGDRETAPRPCDLTDCRYHLSGFVHPGRVASIQRDESETCALDVADLGPFTLDEIGSLVGVSRQRVKQIEEKALRKLRIRARAYGLDPRDMVEPPPRALDPVLSEEGEQRKRRRLYMRLWSARLRSMKASSA